MRPALRLASISLPFACSLFSPFAFAQHAALPASLVALDSEEGQRLLVEADRRRAFFPLVEALTTQNDPGYCGVASAVTVLNALQVRAPLAAPWGAPFFTQENLFTLCARTTLAPGFKGGMTMQQLADVIRCHPATADVSYASDSTLEAFRASVAKALAQDGVFVIANFERSEIGQEYMGHISPLAAYHPKSDRFLILDVARYKYAPEWVDAAALFRAMDTKDIVAGRSRGWITVKAAASAPGPSGAPRPRSPIRILFAMLAAAFVLGVAIGAEAQALRYRGKLTRVTGGATGLPPPA